MLALIWINVHEGSTIPVSFNSLPYHVDFLLRPLYWNPIIGVELVVRLRLVGNFRLLFKVLVFFVKGKSTGGHELFVGSCICTHI